MPKILTEEQLEQWDRNGAVWPVDLIGEEEATDHQTRGLTTLRPRWAARRNPSSA